MSSFIRFLRSKFRKKNMNQNRNYLLILLLILVFKKFTGQFFFNLVKMIFDSLMYFNYF